MEDWQGCLSPICQTALQNACTSVTRRGGHAVTLEDFLLAMLDGIPDLCRFLQRQGVDLDELTRTIQCEQPIVTEVASENLLASQLVYWFASAREISTALWLEWPELLQALVHNADRLQEKAYVAVLEQVAHWPLAANAPAGGEGSDEDIVVPSVIADATWMALVDDISVKLAAEPRAAIWVYGERGTGKSSWLRALIDALPGGAIELDIRREADILASDHAALPVHGGPGSVAPTLVLDNVSPADLMTLMASEFSVARELATAFPGPVLLLGPDSGAARAAIKPLQELLGRTVECHEMPQCSASQKQAILTAHQPLIEKRWGIELAPGAIEHAAARSSASVASPGGMIQWVEQAAARLSLVAEHGPLAARVLEGEANSLRRQSLLALARQQPTLEHLEARLESVVAEQVASEALWHERNQQGTLRLLTVKDLEQELDRRVAAAARAGQYNAHQEQCGECEFAGP